MQLKLSRFLDSRQKHFKSVHSINKVVDDDRVIAISNVAAATLVATVDALVVVHVVKIENHSVIAHAEKIAHDVRSPLAVSFNNLLVQQEMADSRITHVVIHTAVVVLPRHDQLIVVANDQMRSHSKSILKADRKLVAARSLVVDHLSKATARVLKNHVQVNLASRRISQRKNRTNAKECQSFLVVR
jgi:hypothetical protein